MKFRYPIIIAIFLVLVTMLVSGCCCCTSMPNIPGTPTISGSTYTPAATTSTSAPGMNLKSFSVLAYKMTSISDDGTTSSFSLRMEVQPTQVHYTMTLEGQTTPLYDQTIPIDQIASGASSQQVSSALSDAMSPDFTAKLQKQPLPESVTVPAGTYLCNKYTSTNENVVTTYWLNSGIAAPVKMTTAQDGKVVTMMELEEFEK